MSIVPQGLKMPANGTANPAKSKTRSGRNFNVQERLPRSGVMVAEMQPMLAGVLVPWMMKKVAEKEAKAYEEKKS